MDIGSFTIGIVFYAKHTNSIEAIMKRSIPVSPTLWALLSMGVVCSSCSEKPHDYIVEMLELDNTQVKALPEGGSYDIHALTANNVVLSQPNVTDFDKTIYNSVTPTHIDAKWYSVSIDSDDRRCIHIQVSPNDTEQERSGFFLLYTESFDAECWVTVVQPCAR